jgi:hypothetical protein
MICGLVGELSVIVRVADFVPAFDPHGAITGDADGVKVTVSVQLPLAGTPAMQLFVAVKLPAGFTLALATVTIAGAVPLFEIVTVMGVDAVPASALPKPIVAEGETVAAACTAVPLTATVCGLRGSVWEIITSAERLPDGVGSKVTLITQVWPPASGLCEQSSVSAKSPGFVPAMLMVIGTGVVPYC